MIFFTLNPSLILININLVFSIRFEICFIFIFLNSFFLEMEINVRNCIYNMSTFAVWINRSFVYHIRRGFFFSYKELHIQCSIYIITIELSALILKSLKNKYQLRSLKSNHFHRSFCRTKLISFPQLVKEKKKQPYRKSSF